MNRETTHTEDAAHHANGAWNGRKPAAFPLAAALLMLGAVIAGLWLALPGGLAHFQAAILPPASILPTRGEPALAQERPSPTATMAPSPIASATLSSPAEAPAPAAAFTPLPQVSETLAPSPTPPPTLTPLPGSAQPPQTAPAAPTGGKSIVVSIAQQHVYAYEGGKLVFSFAASTGQNNGTLPGSYSILDKDPNAYSYPWGFWMPDWMGIYYAGYDLENGFHSLPVLANGEELWGDQIGTPITYGCIVLQPGDMRQLFEWADVGTPVEIVP